MTNILHQFALLQLGFRLFFLLALSYSCWLMCLWTGFWSQHLQITHPFNSIVDWHAHEMIFGVGVAVVTGFLLTAVKNWTSSPTTSPFSLLILGLLWVIPRILSHMNSTFSNALLLFTCLGFYFTLMLSISIPIIRTKNYRNLPVVLLVLIIAGCDVSYLLKMSNEHSQRFELLLAFHIFILLILFFLRRLIPFFMKKGTGKELEIKNNFWLDVSCGLIFGAYIGLEALLPEKQLTYWLALLLVILHTVRLALWWRNSVLKKSLLWSLFLSYFFIILGFMMKFLSQFLTFLPQLHLHVWAVGGFGLVTLSMMARVSIGHTGRDIHQPPKFLSVIFLAMGLSALFRSLFPALHLENFTTWILCSQILWIFSTLALLCILCPMLCFPRVDGKEG